jgi:hypothetical protein
MQRTDPEGEPTMAFDLGQIVNLVGQLGGDHGQALQRLQGLGGQVDPQQHGGVLRELGIDPDRLAGGGYQQHLDAQQDPGFQGYQQGLGYQDQGGYQQQGGGYQDQGQGGFEHRQEYQQQGGGFQDQSQGGFQDQSGAQDEGGYREDEGYQR